MTDNDVTGSATPDKDPAPSGQQGTDMLVPGEDPGYLVRTGEAVGDDGSVVAIVGGLPAVEGSAWDFGAPLDERGGDPEHERDSQQDTRG